MENRTVFGFKTNITRIGSDGNNSAVKLDSQKRFKMILGFDEVVLVHLKEGVVDGVAKISLTTVCKRNQLGKSLDIFLMISTADEGDECTEQVGDSDDLIAFIGSDYAGFSAGVHGSGDTGEFFITGQKKCLSDDRGACSTTDGDNFWHA